MVIVWSYTTRRRATSHKRPYNPCGDCGETSAWLLIGLGVVSGLAGVVALTLNQPYLVWFPLLLGAALLLGIIPFRLRSYLKHYEDLELRRMTAIDALKG